jgi:tetratricopeptide (TPR) repeat protein
LNTKAVILYSTRGRRREGYALLKYALEVAVENDMNLAALRAYYNLADLATQSDRYQESRDYVDEGLALARRIGSRDQEWRFLSQTYPHFVSGDWDDVIAMAEQIPKEKVAEARLAGSAFLLFLPLVHANRGESDLAEEALSIFPSVDSSADIQEQQADATGRAVVHLAKGEPRESLAEARKGLTFLDAAGPGAEASKEAFVTGIDAAFELGEIATVEELVQMIERIPRGGISQYLSAHAMRTRGRLAAQRGDEDQAEAGFKGAAGLFREMAAPFHMAVVMLELSEWLEARGRGAEARPPLDEAREIFEGLGAKPWLARLERTDASKQGATTP